jgi:hypothetical protein
LGTAAGLTAYEINSDTQLYEMRMGTHTVAISNNCEHNGVAYISFAGKYTYYDIATLKENYNLTDVENLKVRNEFIRELAATSGNLLIKALLEQHGLERCRDLLNEAAPESRANKMLNRTNWDKAIEQSMNKSGIDSVCSTSAVSMRMKEK